MGGMPEKSACVVIRPVEMTSASSGGSGWGGGAEFFDSVFGFGKACFKMDFAVAADGEDSVAMVYKALDIGIGGAANGWICAGAAEAVDTAIKKETGDK
jgi:hypothetical protein